HLRKIKYRTLNNTTLTPRAPVGASPPTAQPTVRPTPPAGRGARATPATPATCRRSRSTPPPGTAPPSGRRHDAIAPNDRILAPGHALGAGPDREVHDDCRDRRVIMGERSSYGPGTFCWVDLPSRDPELSKRFYSAILQWEYDERTGAVSVAERYHARVAAIFGADERVRVRRVQQWQNFISVNDADATSARAADLGGSVEVEPFDVSLACRAAAITDPTGALFWLWQPRRHAGAARVNDPGCFTWNELH